MDEIKQIVARLNQPPFDEKLTLVEFASKNPQALLQIVNNVFAVLDAKHKSVYACLPLHGLPTHHLS